MGRGVVIEGGGKGVGFEVNVYGEKREDRDEKNTKFVWSFMFLFFKFLFYLKLVDMLIFGLSDIF